MQRPVVGKTVFKSGTYMTWYERHHFVYHSLPQIKMSSLECSQSVIQWFILFKVANATSKVSDDQATL